MADSIQDLLPNVNVNVVKPKNKNNVNVTQVRSIATKLSDSLGDTHSTEFYCKVAWHLPEAFIWNQLEVALSKRKPAAYFSAVCKANMQT